MVFSGAAWQLSSAAASAFKWDTVERVAKDPSLLKDVFDREKTDAAVKKWKRATNMVRGVGLRPSLFLALALSAPCRPCSRHEEEEGHQHVRGVGCHALSLLRAVSRLSSALYRVTWFNAGRQGPGRMQCTGPHARPHARTCVCVCVCVCVCLHSGGIRGRRTPHTNALEDTFAMVGSEAHTCLGET